MHTLETDAEQVAEQTETEKLKIQLLQDDCKEAWAVADASCLECGHKLKAVRDAMKWGGFEKWYLGNGWAKNEVNYRIRLAEGKYDKPKPKPVPDYIFNRRNLLVANAAGADDKFASGRVLRADKYGTTSADNKMLARVSLPAGNNDVSDRVGFIPADFAIETAKQLTRPPANGSCVEVTFRNKLVTFSNPENKGTSSRPAPDELQCEVFPDIERLLKEVEEADESCRGTLDEATFRRFTSLINNFDGRTVELRFKGKYLICKKVADDGQTLFCLADLDAE